MSLAQRASRLTGTRPAVQTVPPTHRRVVAAGLAAVLWSRHPDWSPREIRAALEAAAEDLGPAGHDYETGYGRIHLP